LQRDAKQQPVSAKELARSLPVEAWKKVTWRQGVKQKLQSRFAACECVLAHRDYWRVEPHHEEWLLIEWPADEKSPPNTKTSDVSRRSSRLTQFLFLGGMRSLATSSWLARNVRGYIGARWRKFPAVLFVGVVAVICALRDEAGKRLRVAKSFDLFI
jgi:hypothetical protein